jgi:hypothetical protein
MANPNIVATTVITGNTSVLVVPASLSAIVTNASSSGKVYKVNLLMAANTSEGLDVDVQASLRRGGVDYFIAKIVAVPADGSLVLIGKENPIYLNEGDSLMMAAETSGSLHGICSYEIIQ